jgi:GTP pyrophosphokinase
LKKIIGHFNLNNKEQLYSELGMGSIDLKNINEILGKKSENKLVKYWNITFGGKKKTDISNNTTQKIDNKKPFILKEAQDNISYSLAKCCNPIPGEKVVGVLSSDDHVNIHKTGCQELAKYLSNHGDRIITAEWTKFKRQSYLTRLKLKGFDRIGIANQITTIISKENNINMRSLHFDAHEGIFSGDLFLYIHNADDLNNLIDRLNKIKGIDNVSRIENLND